MNEKLSGAAEIYEVAVDHLETITYLVDKGVDDVHGGKEEWENICRALLLLEKVCKEAKADIERTLKKLDKGVEGGRGNKRRIE